MAIRSEAPDLAVDELQRRARRRLVGAIVLALAAAVILPLLLESDPKPLGDDVSIRIPPIDNGKFINPLSPGKGSESAAPSTPAQKAQPAVPAATPTPRVADAKPTAAPPAAELKTAAKPEATSAPAETAATGAGFVVQLGAFAEAKVAADLVATLRSSGFSAYTEALTTAQGVVQRVRVVPFASRDAADAALAKLKLAGYNDALVSSAK